MQVRLASTRRRPEPVVRRALTAKFADCFTRLSQFRVFNDGNPTRSRDSRNVTRRSVDAARRRTAYFWTRCRRGADRLPLRRLRRRQLGNTRPTSTCNVSGQLHRHARTASDAAAAGLTTPGGVLDRTEHRAHLVASPARNNITDLARLGRQRQPPPEWPSTDPAEVRRQPVRVQRAAERPPRVRRDTRRVRPASGRRRARPDVAAGRAPYPVLGLHVPGAPLENVNTGGGGGIPPSPITIYPTVGIRTRPQDRRPHHAPPRRPAGEPACSAATRTSRRARSSAPSDTAASRGTAANPFTNGPWWNTTTKTCPRARVSSSRTARCPPPSASTARATPGAACRPRRASPSGRSATTSASRPRTAATSTTTRASRSRCNYVGNYDGIEPDGTGSTRLAAGKQPARSGLARTRASSTSSSSRTSRSRDATGGDPQETVPILDFASFYVIELDGAEQPPERPVPGPRRSTTTRTPSTPAIRSPTPPRGAITRRLRRDGRLRVRPGRSRPRSASRTS